MQGRLIREAGRSQPSQVPLAVWLAMRPSRCLHSSTKRGKGGRSLSNKQSSICASSLNALTTPLSPAFSFGFSSSFCFSRAFSSSDGVHQSVQQSQPRLSENNTSSSRESTMLSDGASAALSPSRDDQAFSLETQRALTELHRKAMASGGARQPVAIGASAIGDSKQTQQQQQQQQHVLHALVQDALRLVRSSVERLESRLPGPLLNHISEAMSVAVACEHR